MFCPINETHHVIESNCLLEIMSTNRYNNNFQAEIRMNCKLCRMISRVLSSIVVVHRLMQKGNIIQFRWRLNYEIWSQTGSGEKFHQWLGTLVAWKNELLLLRTIFWRMVYQSCKLLLLYGFNYILPTF